MIKTFATLASIATAAYMGYESMAPTGKLYGATFCGLTAGDKKIALTYDDGPNDPHTLRLMEVLAKHGVKATFFLIGQYVQSRPDIVRELSAAGHDIGNHTFTHPNLIVASRLQTQLQLLSCNQAIENATGKKTRWFRPPFGGRRPATLRMADELGLRTVMWNVTGWDWNEKPAAYVEGKVTAQVRGGDVILLHDGGHSVFGADRSQTVIATDRLITGYKALGYEFVSIQEMAASPITP